MVTYTKQAHTRIIQHTKNYSVLKKNDPFLDLDKTLVAQYAQTEAALSLCMRICDDIKIFTMNAALIDFDPLPNTINNSLSLSLSIFHPFSRSF